MRTIAGIGRAIGHLVNTIVRLVRYPVDSRNLIPGKPVSVVRIFDRGQRLYEGVPTASSAR